jgi:SAM-dependent methyltransferase
MVLRLQIEVAKMPKAAFSEFSDELTLALRRLGVEFQPRAGGTVLQAAKEVGRVVAWHPGKGFEIQWHSPDWEPRADSKITFKFRGAKKGTMVTVELDRLESNLGAAKSELFGWFTDRVTASLLDSLTPLRIGDWVTDRLARRPTGTNARKVYRNPTHHLPNFRAIMERLNLSRDDYLLEVGCGGGAFLKDALRSGCRAAAIDHSPEMVRLTRRINASAIRDGRLEVRESGADSLPFGNSSFTCAASTGVLGFLPDAARTFSEVNRVLAAGGRMVVFAGSKETLGTPAAPEPMASRIHFYEDEELERMAIEAGFSEAHVERPDLSRFVKGSGVPKKDVGLFSGRGGQLLIARKS